MHDADAIATINREQLATASDRLLLRGYRVSRHRSSARSLAPAARGSYPEIPHGPLAEGSQPRIVLPARRAIHPAPPARASRPFAAWAPVPARPEAWTEQRAAAWTEQRAAAWTEAWTEELPEEWTEERTERDERPEWIERTERIVRPQWIDQPQRAERIDRTERPQQIERIDRTERPQQIERTGRIDRPQRIERAERAERIDRTERPQRIDRTVPGRRGALRPQISRIALAIPALLGIAVGLAAMR